MRLSLQRGTAWLGALTLAVVLASCGSDVGDPHATRHPADRGRQRLPAPPAHAAVPGSTVIGTYVLRPGPGAAARGIGRQKVGLFREGVASTSGTVTATKSDLVATATTSADGGFVFNDVPAGRWFVITEGPTPVPVRGRWVRVTTEQGAEVDLVGCPECAAP